jgi:aminopeptidase N
MDADITRDQTRERARLLRVRSYDVDLDFTRGPESFGSVSLIRFDCREPGATTHADLIAIGPDGGRVERRAVERDLADARRRITLPALADRNELRVVADCAYTSSGTGLHRTDSADGSVHIYAKLAQAGLRPHRLRLLRPARPQVGVRLPGHRARWLSSCPTNRCR